MTPVIDCAAFRSLAKREAKGQVSAREFAALDRHRERCARCAAAMRQDDSLAAFRALAAEERPAAAWAGLWEGVRAGIRAEGSLGLGEGLRLLSPTSRVAAAALLVVGLAVAALAVPRLKPQLPPVAAAPDRPVLPAVLHPTVESIQSPGARIYEVKLFGENERVTEVVMIVDQGIEL
jgi:anti-sigma factor RsiW